MASTRPGRVLLRLPLLAAPLLLAAAPDTPGLRLGDRGYLCLGVGHGDALAAGPGAVDA